MNLAPDLCHIKAKEAEPPWANGAFSVASVALAQSAHDETVYLLTQFISQSRTLKRRRLLIFTVKWNEASNVFVLCPSARTASIHPSIHGKTTHNGVCVRATPSPQLKCPDETGTWSLVGPRAHTWTYRMCKSCRYFLLLSCEATSCQTDLNCDYADGSMGTASSVCACGPVKHNGSIVSPGPVGGGRGMSRTR